MSPSAGGAGPVRRVLLATRIYAPEAAAATFRLTALVRALALRGATVQVVTSAIPAHLRGGEAARGSEDALQVSRWPVLRDAAGYVRGYLPYLSFDLPLAVRLLAAPRPDVVVVEPPPTTGAVSRVVCGLRRLPYVYYAADIWSDATASMGAPGLVVTAMRSVERFALRGARDVVAVSDGVADRVCELVGQRTRPRVSVIPNGIDTDVFTPSVEPGSGSSAPASGPGGAESPVATGTPYLLYAGTASEWQGAEIFAEAMREVLTADPAARLVFLGQGSSWPVLERIRAELGDGAIELRPLVPPAEAAAWHRGAAAALVSVRPGIGYDFAYPTKVLAALACGTPVIFAGPDSPAARELREHGLGEAVEYEVAAVAEAMLGAFRAAWGARVATSAEPGERRAKAAEAAQRSAEAAEDAQRRADWVREHRSLASTGERVAEIVLS